MKDGYFWYLRFLGCFSMWKKPALSFFHAEKSWVQLDQIKKNFKKIGSTSLKCFVTSNMMAFGQKNSTEHLIKCLHSLNDGQSLSETKCVSKQQREECLRRCFFSCKSSFLPQRLEDFCSKTETQNGHLQIPSNSDI